MSLADPTAEQILTSIRQRLAQGITLGLTASAPVMEELLVRILKEIQEMAVTIKDVLAKVTAQTTVVNSVVTLLGQLSQMLKDAQASGDPAALQGVIDVIDANDAALAKAAQDNTPGGTPPTPQP